MGNDIDIRLMTIADLELLRKICIEAYSQNFFDHWEPGRLKNYLDDVFGTDLLAAELCNKEIQYYVAFSDKKPVAFMKLNLSPIVKEQNKKNNIELDKIYVLPECKGKKIGKRLMDLAFDIAGRNNKEVFWLSVIDTNKEAILFYEKLGFRFHDAIRLNYPGFKEELKGMWRMCLEFNSQYKHPAAITKM